MPTRLRPSGRPVSRAIALAITAASGLAACGADAGVITVSASPGTTVAAPSTTAPAPSGSTPTVETAPDVPTPTDVSGSTLPPIVEPELETDIPFDDVVNADPGKPVRSYDEFVAVAFTDIQRWWGEVYPDVYGGEFSPLEGGVYAGYPERTSTIPGCEGPSSADGVTSYEDLQLYVAFYCEFGDFVAYDDGGGRDSLLAPLAEELGPAVVGVVLAHEYGHAIQQRSGALARGLPTIYTEQQADCFAGAWTGQAYRGESPLLRLGDKDVRTGLVAMLSVRDPIGTNQFQAGGHGSAFDRVGAFQEGFAKGPARCAELLDSPLDLMPNEFIDDTDLSRGGNAPYDCSGDPDPQCVPAYQFLADDLNEFWTISRPGFAAITPVATDDLGATGCAEPTDVFDLAVLCDATRQLFYDEPEILDLYGQFGDFTLGYVYGSAWAEAAQEAAGSTLTGEPRALMNDCLVGAWVEDITTFRFRSDQRTSQVGTSPGDLDESIRMAILEGDQGAQVDEVGSPFEKIAAFRTGVLGGLSACDTFQS